MAIIAKQDGQYVKMIDTNGGSHMSHQICDIESVSVSGTTVIVSVKNSCYVHLFDGETGRYLGTKRT